MSQSTCFIVILCLCSGKRHLVERSPFGLSKLKLPRKSITVASKEVGESRRDFEIRRKSKRNVKKIPSYCYSSSDSGEEEESSSRSPSFLQTKAHPFKAKLRRKVVSNIQGSRLFSHKTYVDSPVNALDDAFYSGSVTILHSAVGNSRDDHTGTLVEKVSNLLFAINQIACNLLYPCFGTALVLYFDSSMSWANLQFAWANVVCI